MSDIIDKQLEELKAAASKEPMHWEGGIIADIVWTKEIPTKPGLYLCRYIDEYHGSHYETICHLDESAIKNMDIKPSSEWSLIKLDEHKEILNAKDNYF